MARHLPLNEEHIDTAQEFCEMCGAVLHDDYADREEHSDTEIIRELALFMVDDWKACSVLQLYVACPNATIGFIAEKIRIGRTEVCDARDRAAARFPAMDSMLALRTPRADSQRERRADEKIDNGQTDLF